MHLLSELIHRFGTHQLLAVLKSVFGDSIRDLLAVLREVMMLVKREILLLEGQIVGALSCESIRLRSRILPALVVAVLADDHTHPFPHLLARLANRQLLDALGPLYFLRVVIGDLFSGGSRMSGNSRARKMLAVQIFRELALIRMELIQDLLLRWSEAGTLKEAVFIVDLRMILALAVARDHELLEHLHH